MTEDEATRELQSLHSRRVYVHPMNTAVFWAVIAGGVSVGLLAFRMTEVAELSVAISVVAGGAAGYFYERRKNRQMVAELRKTMGRSSPRPWTLRMG